MRAGKVFLIYRDSDGAYFAERVKVQSMAGQALGLGHAFGGRDRAWEFRKRARAARFLKSHTVAFAGCRIVPAWPL